jgi:hypothetical protein
LYTADITPADLYDYMIYSCCSYIWTGQARKLLYSKEEKMLLHLKTFLSPYIIIKANLNEPELLSIYLRDIKPE